MKEYIERGELESILHNRYDRLVALLDRNTPPRLLRFTGGNEKPMGICALKGAGQRKRKETSKETD